MKLTRFVQLLQQNNIAIDTEENGLIFAHYIHRYYHVISEEMVHYVITKLDKDGYFGDVYKSLRNTPFWKKTNPDLWDKQTEILSGFFAKSLDIIRFSETKSKNNKKKEEKHIRINYPCLGFSEADKQAVPRKETKRRNRHRYELDRFRSPTMSIGSNGLVSVDGRYARLREDYDDK